MDVGNILGINQPPMQTIEISIWVIRSTFKGRSTGGWEGDLQKCDCPIQERVQIGKLRNLPCPLNVDPIVQIEVFIVCTKMLVCTENFHAKAIMSENKTIYYRRVFENKTMQVTMHLEQIHQCYHSFAPMTPSMKFCTHKAAGN